MDYTIIPQQTGRERRAPATLLDCAPSKLLPTTPRFRTHPDERQRLILSTRCNTSAAVAFSSANISIL